LALLVCVSLCIFLSLGCGDETTSVVVRLTASASLRGEASALQIQIYDDADQVVYDQTRPDTDRPATLVLPANLPVVPQEGREMLPFRVEAVLRDADGAMLGVQRARTTAVPGEERELWLCFEEGCRDVSCDADQRCVSGICVGMDMDPQPPGVLDAISACGESPDGGVPDGGFGTPSAEFSEIEGGTARADGVEGVTVSIVLRDDMNRPVPGVTPRFDAMGTGLSLDQNCTPTDAAGVSMCDAALRSTTVQTAQLEIAEPVRTAGGEAVFEAPWVYRSVGPGASAALADGAGGTLTIADSRATLASALPGRAGVGDVLTYDSDGDGSVDALAFIHGRISPTEIELRNADGLAATPTSAPTTEWALHRAYTSLSEADRGAENGAIDPSLSNFDTWPAVDGEDLIARQRVWNIACYGDAPDTSRASFSRWASSAETYLRIFTPHRPTEVGESQRHQGVWNDGAYRLEVGLSGDYSHALQVEVDYVRVEGLQLRVTGTANIEAGGITVPWGVGDENDIRFSNNLVAGAMSPGTATTAGIWIADDSSHTTVWNNIVYDFQNESGQSGGIRIRGASACVSHNTVFDSQRGFNSIVEGVLFLRNNVSLGNTTQDYRGTFAAESHHNASSDGSGPPDALVMLSSADPTEYFRSATDFRIDPGAPSASELIDTGDVYPEDLCPLPDEAINGAMRPQGAGPDLGAYETSP